MPARLHLLPDESSEHLPAVASDSHKRIYHILFVYDGLFDLQLRHFIPALLENVQTRNHLYIVLWIQSHRSGKDTIF